MKGIPPDSKHVHNSSTDMVNNIFNCLYSYPASKTVINMACRKKFQDKNHARESVQSNLTSNTSERKTRDFYTILSGCPQNRPIYPLYFSFEQLFIDSVLVLLQQAEK